MGRVIGLILGGVAAFNGIAILTASECESVSFDGQGSRVAVAQCFADSSGALPAWLAGVGMVLLGVAIGAFVLKR
jgi:hypothetical protein